MKEYPTMHDIEKSERPRERLKENGPEHLSSADLIAIILGSGTKGVNVMQLAQDLLFRFGGVRNLADATVEELCQVKGMGSAKAIQLKAALGLSKRVDRDHVAEGEKILCARDAYRCVREDIEFKTCEIVIALLLDTKSKLIKKALISVGSLNSSIVHPREVFHPAVRHKACGIILAHNHPSGDPTPSEADLEVTRDIYEVGGLMGIPLRDHIIVGRARYVSIMEGPGCN